MRTVCQVCMHHCNLEEGQKGICGARINQGGTIRCDNYGKVTALALVLHPANNQTSSTAYFAICRVVVSQRCHRIASFLRLAG